MSLRWNLRMHDAQRVQALERDANLSPILAQILVARGFDSAAAVERFFDLRMTGLRPPEELPGLEKAVALILEAARSGKKIWVYGDYDADGMTATAILYRCLKLLGADVHYFVPCRLEDGYGLNCQSLEQLRQRGAEWIVTVDCGIASPEEVAFAKSLGMGIIVTDHHQPGPQRPAADAIVHPGLPDRPYPFPGLCGAGVAFKLAWGLGIAAHGSAKLPNAWREHLFSAIGLAAIGTVCDVVPMREENRILVHHGLQCLRDYCGPGLKHLMSLSGSLQQASLTTEDIGFSIGPRLNAAGRLGQALLGVELLTSEDPDRARELAEYLDQLNGTRKSLEIKIQRSAEKLLQHEFDADQDPALVLAQSDWHLGVIGIVAGRLAEKYHRPTVLISLDEQGRGIGSCRSACGIDLYEALSQCEPYLERFGGHTAAAGLTIRADQVAAFRTAFYEQIASQAGTEELRQDLDVDAEALIGHLTFNTMRELEQLAPFGEENPSPVMMVAEAELEQVSTMGAEDQHLSLRLSQHGSSIRAVGFGKASWLDDLEPGGKRYDFVFRPVINRFRGQQSVELHLIDFRPSQSSVVLP